MKVDVVLTGIHSGKTILLAGKQFVGGKYTVEGAPIEVEGQLRYLSRMYQAHPVGSAELAKAQERDKQHGIQHHAQAATGQRDAEAVQGGVGGSAGPVSGAGNDGGAGPERDSSAGSPVLVAAGGGLQDSGLLPEQVARLRGMLRKLDPQNDKHWTEDGLPSVEVVAEALVDPSISRAMIDVAAPGFNREKATEMAAPPDDI